jgi:putative transposase
LALKSRSGEDLEVRYSNQVWQADHTRVDVLVVDQSGAVLGRPWLTIVVDSYSRCIMGMHLGMEAPSAAVVCLALRHAILPKHYSSSYGLSQSWSSYGIPQCLYSDSGKDFQGSRGAATPTQHIEQVALELGINCEQRRYPSEGGIVERPFGTFNSEVFSTLPGYTGSNVSRRPKQAETSARLTLMELEKLLVGYIVDRYNQSLDARSGKQTRQGRWEAGCITLPVLVGERDLDICLMRQERRHVYRGGYIQYANLSYRGEHLAGYAGETVTIRYNPRDITSILIYQRNGVKETFLTRAHAQGLETECLSLAEAQAISRRVRAAGRIVSNQSVLAEVRRRDAEVSQLRRGRKPKPSASSSPTSAPPPIPSAVTLLPSESQSQEPGNTETSSSPAVRSEPGDERDLLTRPVPHVVVRDYEEWKQEYGLW